MDLKGRSCLVTGGAGFIGSHLVDALIEKKCRVRVLDNFVNGKPENMAAAVGSGTAEVLRGSVTDPFDVQRAMDGIDAVFHLACLGVRHSLSHPFENHRTNAEGTLLVLEAARQVPVERFVYCSSSEVYGTARQVPMAEDHPTHPCTVYGAGKLAGEAYARAYHLTHGMPVVVLRPFNTYGPRSHHEGDAGEVIPKSIVRALNGRPILVFGDGSQTRDFTYVTDTARALIAAAETDSLVGGTYNAGSGFEISIRELAETILGLAGAPGAAVEFGAGRPGDVMRLFADAARFRAESGWQPETGFEEGLRRTIAHFRQGGRDPARLLSEEVGRNWQEAVE